jgi:SAM-dependent methyltransferase
MAIVSLERAMGAGAAAGRAVAGVPRGLARRGAPLVGRLAGVAGVGGPDSRLARDRYRELAAGYDVRTATGDPYRRQTVDRLAPMPGEVILDVGCGTGLNFAAIEEGIGPRGRLIGIELCPEMLALARDRVERSGWHNVSLVPAAAEDAAIPATADAALLCGVHDVMRSPPALANVLAHLREGGRVVAGGPKWAPWWHPGSPALNLSTWAGNRDCVTTFEGFDRPWGDLAALVGDLEVEELCLGAAYIAAGTR